MALVLYIFVLAVLVYIIKEWLWLGGTSGGKQLPGPKGLPIVGSLPFVGIKPFETITEMGKGYGDIFMLKLGIKKVIVLNSEDVIRDALGKDHNFAGRPNFPTFKALLNAGAMDTKSRFTFRTATSLWKFLRKNAIKALGTFAASKSSKLQAVVDESREKFHEKIEAKVGKRWNPTQAIFECVASVIGRINFGLEFSVDSPLLKDAHRATEVIGTFFGVGALINNVPFGEYIFAHKIKEFLATISPLFDFTEKQILEHKCNSEVRDIADALYKTATETPEEELKAVGAKAVQIRLISQDLFGAGFATTMDTFKWALNYLAANPREQDKVAAEIDQELGDAAATLHDKERLPYCEAVLLETFRCSSLIPFAIVHFTMADFTFRGFHIPKDTMVLPNLYGHHRNPRIFPQPYTFRPDRFLLPNGQVNMDLAQRLMPFSSGKRRCVGENLARQELFLLIAHTFQHYRVRPAPGVHIDINDCEGGFTRRPKDYDLVFEKR